MPARAALQSCGVVADCPSVGACESRTCSGNACVAGDKAACDCATAGGDTACDDGNPCTTDVCVIDLGGTGTCSHTATGVAGVNGCCATVDDCPAANNACQRASCVAGSCTYTAAATANCCNGASDCGGGASCTANACTCGAGQKYCVTAPGACVASTGCCAASECPAGNTCQTATCTAGACGLTSTGATGCCNPATVTTDCGSGGVCTDNTCSCSTGFKLCNGRCIAATACCSASDCDSASSTGASCAAGVCTYTGCASGRADCDQSGANTNGCETDITSTANCGACGRTCTLTNASAASCTAGVCSYTCASGFGDCVKSGANTDGCETNLNTSAGHCGACGRGCGGIGAATLACTGGLCTSTCVSGRGNCTHPAAPATDDGCETDTSLSLDNCGGCGRACSGANVVARVCTGGVCTSSCVAGSGNCSMPAAPTADNGCETPTTGDINNCGGCNIACAAPANGCQSTRCASSTCGYVSTGNAGCCNTASDCTPNVCQNAACLANQCMYTAKVVSGCCTTPGDCPAQTNPCVVNTCTSNRCGTMAVTCPDLGADMSPSDLGEDMTPPPDLADLAQPDLTPPPADLAVVDQATPDLASPDLAAPLSLTGGGGCAVAAHDAPPVGGALFAFALALLCVRRRARR